MSKKFEITEEQLQTIANVLAEIPAKFSLGALDIIRALPVIPESPPEAE